MIEGFNIEGKWINKFTNKTVYVNNYVFDGDNNMVMTDIGGIPMETFMNDYVQISDDNEYDSYGNITGKASDKPNVQTQPTPVNKINQNIKLSFDQEYTLDDIDYDNIKNNIENKNLSTIKVEENTTTIKETKQNITIENEQIIKKLFDKINDKPQFDLNIEWNDFPKNEISTLINILDINIEDISKYILKSFLSNSVLIEQINKLILDKINDSK